ncbi:peroxidase 12-like [Lycium barbarum]|uniref:peroxidase 12-like n=1 Tax=Lycium barbarum TaxID=112863 RepID=UPI00293EC740|nr:peroxidase 12-like [Lycium barbarum]
MVSTGLASFLLVLAVSSSLIFFVTEAQRPAIVNGLSWSFYQSRCPQLESIIRKGLEKQIKDDAGQAAGMDKAPSSVDLYGNGRTVSVLGCDSSVLLDGSAGGPSEQTANPNLTLRKKSFKIIDDLRKRIQAKCGQVVSCSDITAIAARDSVVLKKRTFLKLRLDHGGKIS